jgi:hypothetical protein
MRSRSFAIRSTVCLAVIVIGSLGTMRMAAEAQIRRGPVPVDCNRACLEGLVDQYLAALVAHDPKRVPLSADVKYTENDQVLDVGDGFWNTASGLGSYKHYFADPVTSQVAFMGTMKEGNGLLLMGLRLRVQLGRITEIETSYYRQGGGGPAGIADMDKLGKPEAVWFETVPPAERVSRNQLIETANAYFEGLQGNDGKGFYPFADDCDRIENGAHTTNNPGIGRANGGFNAMALGCKAQFESGYYGVVTRIHHRRYPLVDEERGVVWGYSIFDHNGTVTKINLTSGQTVDMAMFSRPSSIEVTEAFKIGNGKIRRIEMVGSGVVYHMNPAWPGGLSGK